MYKYSRTCVCVCVHTHKIYTHTCIHAYKQQDLGGAIDHRSVGQIGVP